MSQASAISASAAAPATKKRKLRISISFRFAFFTVLLIAGVMGSVGYSLYVQQKNALTHEVLERGRATAENLAASSREVLATTDKPDVLSLALLTVKAVQREGLTAAEPDYDFSNWDQVLRGMQEAAAQLRRDVPKVLSRSLALITGAEVAGNTDAALAQSSSVENEGILEAIIVDKFGMIASHSKGTSEVGQPYKPPVFVQAASEQTPFPIYEHESFVDGKRFTRRLFQIKESVLVAAGDGTERDFGTIYLGVAEDLIQRVVFQVTMKLLVIALVAVGAGLILTLGVVAWLTRPIGKLVSGVAAIAGGDFDTRLTVSSRDELGELTQSFNTMAVSLGQNEMLKGAFTRYVSDAALKQILSDPSKTGLHSKRTLATIYTSDVRGFTSMSESLEPEQVVQVINTYLSCQTEIILKHGGVVDKFVGDATIGVWGKEQPGADDAINAVRAAMEAQQYIDTMNQEREARGEVAKLIGIGVNTGEVVSGNMGSSKKMEYTVTGEHVIYADQICNDCPGGKVLISESTYQVVKDQVEVEPFEMKTKGHGDAARVWLVTRLK